MKHPENIEPVDYDINVGKRFTRSYKTMWESQKETNKGLLFTLGLTLATSGILWVGCDIGSTKLQAQINSYKQLSVIASDMAFKYNTLNDDLTVQLASCSAKIPKAKKSVGKVSYYSKDGCIGCNAAQKMANGQIFNENAMTLAHNSIPLNTKVTVKNLTNGLFTTAIVTDRGGFTKYGRVADLSKGLYEAIAANTDKSIIEITWE